MKELTRVTGVKPYKNLRFLLEERPKFSIHLYKKGTTGKYSAAIPFLLFKNMQY
jgi:hypothetical protein